LPFCFFSQYSQSIIHADASKYVQIAKGQAEQK
jgi:hypothetical protein